MNDKTTMIIKVVILYAVCHLVGIMLRQPLNIQLTKYPAEAAIGIKNIIATDVLFIYTP